MLANADVKSTGSGNSSIDTLYALRDLDFDYQTDKLTEEDYQNIRTELLTQAAVAIESRQEEDARIEELLRIRRRNRPGNGNCLQCGQVFQDENKFCPECGHARIF